VEKCIKSWEKYFPEYEILEWNESNYDIKKNLYLKEAYECKKWAFVSDYARFDILNKYGGIYFDTDVEVLKKFPDYFFNNIAFTGVESTNFVSPGLIFACEPNFPILSEILESYEKEHFIINGKANLSTVNMRLTNIMENKGFVRNGDFQLIDNLAIYPSKYFCGFNLDLHEPEITSRTITIHHYAHSWASGKDLTKRKARELLKKVIGLKGYSFIQHMVRKFRAII
jgi:mannosyltransferase OCH1-like enzyme